MWTTFACDYRTFQLWKSVFFKNVKQKTHHWCDRLVSEIERCRGTVRISLLSDTVYLLVHFRTEGRCKGICTYLLVEEDNGGSRKCITLNVDTVWIRGAAGQAAQPLLSIMSLVVKLCHNFFENYVQILEKLCHFFDRYVVLNSTIVLSDQLPSKCNDVPVMVTELSSSWDSESNSSRMPCSNTSDLSQTLVSLSG